MRSTFQGNAVWTAERSGDAVENGGSVLEGRLNRCSGEDWDRARAALAEARRKLFYPPKVQNISDTGPGVMTS